MVMLLPNIAISRICRPVSWLRLSHITFNWAQCMMQFTAPCHLGWIQRISLYIEPVFVQNWTQFNVTLVSYESCGTFSRHSEGGEFTLIGKGSACKGARVCLRCALLLSRFAVPRPFTPCLSSAIRYKCFASPKEWFFNSSIDWVNVTKQLRL